jgi:hypothetical protein
MGPGKVENMGSSMNVPEKDQPRYQHLKKIADLLDWAGDIAGAEFTEEAREAYALARKFHDRAAGLATRTSAHAAVQR